MPRPGQRDGSTGAALRRPLTRRGFLGLLAIAGLGACVDEESPEETATVREGTSIVSAPFYERTIEKPRPVFDPDTYRLAVDGLVRRPLSLTYAELLALPSTSQTCDFRCVEGWGVGDVPWEGVQLRNLIEMAQPLPGARFVTFHCLGDQYQESLSMEQAEMSSVLLAYRMSGKPLPPEHGSPLRVVFPRMFGYKGAKWVTRIELRSERDQGYWEGYGYSPDAWVQDDQPCGGNEGEEGR